MDGKLKGRSPVMIVASLALLLALAAGYLFWPRSKPETDAQKRPAVGAAAESEAAGCSAAASAARSPKELALAGFLGALKLDGKPVLIEFGMVGCVLSGQGLDSMIALQSARTVPGLAFVRVEGNPDAAVVAQYFKDKAPSFPVYRDSQSALAKALGATASPTFLLEDKFGHIRYQGNYPQENLVQWGKALAAENQDPGGSVPQFGRREMDVEKLLAAKLPDLKDQMKPLGEYKGSSGLMLLFVDTSCPFSAAAKSDSCRSVSSRTSIGIGSPGKAICQAASHICMSWARVVAGEISNSWSRWRSGFSPSLVRKSVRREPMLPAMCFMMTATLFDSGSSWRKSSWSESWEMAPSARRLWPRSARRASSR
jgi:hypothetical protein